MKKEKLTTKDEALIEEAYSTTYRSTFERLMREAESEKARNIIRNIMNDVELED